MNVCTLRSFNGLGLTANTSVTALAMDPALVKYNSKLSSSLSRLSSYSMVACRTTLTFRWSW